MKGTNRMQPCITIFQSISHRICKRRHLDIAAYAIWVKKHWNNHGLALMSSLRVICICDAIFEIKFWSIYKHSLAFLSTWDVEETFINMSVYLWYNITIRSILFWNYENPLTQSCEGVTKLNVYFTNPNGELDMVN